MNHADVQKHTDFFAKQAASMEAENAELAAALENLKLQAQDGDLAAMRATLDHIHTTTENRVTKDQTAHFHDVLNRWHLRGVDTVTA